MDGNFIKVYIVAIICMLCWITGATIGFGWAGLIGTIIGSIFILSWLALLFTGGFLAACNIMTLIAYPVVYIITMLAVNLIHGCIWFPEKRFYDCDESQAFMMACLQGSFFMEAVMAGKIVWLVVLGSLFIICLIVKLRS